MPEVDQLNAGLAIRGERYRVEIQPRACRLAHEEFDGALYISVAARSSSCGDGWARVTGDAGILARRQDVQLTLTAGGLDELQVLPAKYADLPKFRPGFTLMLEQGMRELILVALQRVECVAQLATAVCTVIEPLLGQPGQVAQERTVFFEAPSLASAATHLEQLLAAAWGGVDTRDWTERGFIYNLVDSRELVERAVGAAAAGELRLFEIGAGPDRL